MTKLIKNKFLQKLQSDKKATRQVRIDAELHYLLKMKAAKSKTTIRNLLEGCLVDLLAVDRQ